MKKEDQFLRQAKISLTPQDRAILVRRGNMLFNEGKILEAKRIFLTANYADGIKRVGDYYLDKQDFAEALKMYKQASSTDSFSNLAEQVVEALRYWMQG